MDADSSLSVLLSQVLVALTIEMDNELEVRLRATWARPFATSFAMWSNVLRFVTEAGTTVGEVAHRGCLDVGALASVVGGLERWGYVVVDRAPGPNATAFGSARGIKPGTVVRASGTGTVVRNLWEPLVAEIEARWSERFGALDELRAALGAIVDERDTAMPPFLPVLSGKGLYAASAVAVRPGERPSGDELPTLLARVLLAFILDYERDAPVSLPIAANVLRLLGVTATPVADLPLASGVSKEAVSLALTWLAGREYVTIAPQPGGRGKVAALTPSGVDAQADFFARLAAVEDDWAKRYEIDAVRASLTAVLESSALCAGLVTPPGGWRDTGRYKPLTRAFVDAPRAALPHAPMVLHRGGWPDGS